MPVFYLWSCYYTELRARDNEAINKNSVWLYSTGEPILATHHWNDSENIDFRFESYNSIRLKGCRYLRPKIDTFNGKSVLCNVVDYHLTSLFVCFTASLARTGELFNREKLFCGYRV